VRAVEEANGLFIGGGNTFRLLSDLYRIGLLNVIRDRVRHGLPYLGVSAGNECGLPCHQDHQRHANCATAQPRRARPSAVPGQPALLYRQTFVKRDDGSFQEHFGERIAAVK
jgi:hypothetical protein